MRTWRGAFVGLLVAVAVIAGWGTVGGAQQRTDAERIAALETRVAGLEGVALPAPAAASEVWNGSFFVFDPEHTFYLYCESKPIGVTLAKQSELKCMGVNPEK